jgi:hypothetical protein
MALCPRCFREFQGNFCRICGVALVSDVAQIQYLRNLRSRTSRKRILWFGATIGFAVIVVGAAIVGYNTTRQSADYDALLFSHELSVRAAAITLPLQGKPGRYRLIVEGHFLPSMGRQNRSAKYSIMVGDGGAEHVLEGTFHQDWGTQRMQGGTRRSALVPVIVREVTRVTHAIENPDGRALTLKLTDLSPELRETVTVQLYGESLTSATR